MTRDSHDFEKEIKSTFLEEAAGMLAEAEQSFLALERGADPALPETLESLSRLAHNLKGTARAVGFPAFAEVTHALEGLLGRIREGAIQLSPGLVTFLLACHDRLVGMIQSLSADSEATLQTGDLLRALEGFSSGRQLEAISEGKTRKLAIPSAAVPTAPPAQLPREETLRVPLARIDQLLNDLGELMILKTILSEHKEQVESELVKKTISQLERTTRRIQNVSMSLRMVPIKPIFQKMRRIVRDLSEQLQKPVEIVVNGLETEIDKVLLDQVSDPLMHLVHNAVDHGLESPEARRAAGKPEVGRITLTASHRGNNILLDCADDGRGLDASQLIEKAVERGLLPKGGTLSPRDAYELIFSPGFSTRKEVSEISGRGVGMDVVKTSVSRLGGKIEIETRPGEGTRFRLVLPFSIAIMDGMVIGLGEERYIFPISQVHETLQPRREEVCRLSERSETLRLRGEVLPLFHLTELLRRKPLTRPPWEAIVMIIRDSASAPYSVVVDDIIGQQQVVTKRLGSEIDGLPGLTGSAILGNGRPALVVDPVKVIEHYQQQREGTA